MSKHLCSDAIQPGRYNPARYINLDAISGGENFGAGEVSLVPRSKARLREDGFDSWHERDPAKAAAVHELHPELLQRQCLTRLQTQ